VAISEKLDAQHGPKQPMSLAEFRTLVTGDPMTAAERALVLAQARTVIDNLYVHLTQKRAMYGIDPSQQLRLLERRQAVMEDASFHRELQRIFDSLRDMHTTYVLPEPYRGRVFLGFVLERYWEPIGDGQFAQRFIVSKPPAQENSVIPVGAEVTHWNGMPIDLAVQRNADSEAGGNPPARFARGLESLTLRNVALSPLPTEDWVHIRYRTDRGTDDRTVHWMVTPDPDGELPDAQSEAGRTTAARRTGISLRTELARRLKKDRLRRPGGETELPDGCVALQERVILSELEGELVARTVTTTLGEFGHLRIHTFDTANGDVARFLKEVERLLGELPPDGLILDVRGNGGGYIEAAEGLLGLLTSAPVQSEPMQLVNSALSYELCGRSRELLRWRQSIGEAGETGALYSAAFPLTVDQSSPQPYPGPVVLITDALSYSATDMLAAGFQDNHIGTVLGVDDNTGAGGANVWSQRQLRDEWPEGPFRPLPKDARLYVALRRSLRVGRQAGRPVEDLGVKPDVRYRITRRDLLSQNADLMERAGFLLDEARRYGS
jgi:C-terminal processing protease CtpA/Prc